MSMSLSPYQKNTTTVQKNKNLKQRQASSSPEVIISPTRSTVRRRAQRFIPSTAGPSRSPARQPVFEDIPEEPGFHDEDFAIEDEPGNILLESAEDRGEGTS